VALSERKRKLETAEGESSVKALRERNCERCRKLCESKKTLVKNLRLLFRVTQ